MVVPKYYWKPVCDLEVKQSIVSKPNNNVDVTSTTQKVAGTYAGRPVTKKKGVLYSYSVSASHSHYFQKW